MEEIEMQIEYAIELLNNGIEDNDWDHVQETIEILEQLYDKIDRVTNEVF